MTPVICKKTKQKTSQVIKKVSVWVWTCKSEYLTKEASFQECVRESHRSRSVGYYGFKSVWRCVCMCGRAAVVCQRGGCVCGGRHWRTMCERMFVCACFWWNNEHLCVGASVRVCMYAGCLSICMHPITCLSVLLCVLRENDRLNAHVSVQDSSLRARLCVCVCERESKRNGLVMVFFLQ